MGKFGKKTRKKKVVGKVLAAYSDSEIQAIVDRAQQKIDVEATVKGCVGASVREMKKHLTAQQVAFELDAVQRYTTIILSVLHDKFGFGHDRLKRLVLEASGRAVAVRETKTKLTDIQDMLRQETRIDICQENCVSVLFGAKGVVVDDDVRIGFRSKDDGK